MRSKTIALLLLTAGAASALIWLEADLTPENWPRDASLPAAALPPRTSRVLIVWLSGISRPAQEWPDLAPFFRDTARRGIGGMLLADGASESDVWSRLAGDAPPWMRPIGERAGDVDRAHEPLLALIAERGFRAGVFALPAWREPFSGWVTWDEASADPGASFPGLSAQVPWTRADERALAAAARVCDDEPWNLVATRLATPGVAARRLGRSPRLEGDRGVSPYGIAVRDADLATKRLADHAGSSAAVFVFRSDAGHPSAHISFAAAGPGIRPHPQRIDLAPRELPALICAILGLRAPVWGTAPLRTELVDLDASELATLRLAGLDAELAFTRAFADVNDFEWAAEAGAMERRVEAARLDTDPAVAAQQLEWIVPELLDALKQRYDRRVERGRDVAKLLLAGAVVLLVAGLTIYVRSRRAERS